MTVSPHLAGAGAGERLYNPELEGHEVARERALAREAQRSTDNLFEHSTLSSKASALSHTDNGV